MQEFKDMSETMELLVQPQKGILAADESTNTIAKRFASINIENTEENRRQYRELLFTTPQLEDHISGVILFEETFHQKAKNGQTFPELLLDRGIVPGIKVDKGLIDLAGTNQEKISIGLDDLEERLVHFKKLGARFAKWRNVFSISDASPSPLAIRAGAETLARYAAICQKVGIVPIVEPEILIDGDHSIAQCAGVCSHVLHAVSNALFENHIHLELMILKTNMITSGKSHQPFSTPDEVAEYTLMVFMNHVPAAVGSIHFLSGGQTPSQSTENLNAINEFGPHPWNISFSYGRALQEDCLKAWAGKEANKEAAQKALYHACQQNGYACTGELHEEELDHVH
ncbi:MAG TPA: fructose-bisphosphate aldolase class I [Legionellales bacterium]|nr:fructose-bisphosphate aldolase class I [Legionellales bacterium]